MLSLATASAKRVKPSVSTESACVGVVDEFRAR